jgi:hypothetical protein
MATHEMNITNSFRQVTSLFLALCASVAALSAQTSPEGMPAHDAHQGVVVAANPYTDVERSKEKFGKKHPQQAGILALEIALRNDTDKPISLNLERLRLNLEVPGEKRQVLEAMTLDAVADQVVNPEGPNPTASRVPIPGRAPKRTRGKDWQKLRETFKNAALDSDVLPPHSTVRGFFYFDISNHFDWLAHSSLYLPGLRFIPSGEELLYFEVELAPAPPR